MKEELLRFKYKQKYLIFDYETCNLNLGLEINKPWQLGYVIAEGKSIKKEEDSWLSWPDLKVSAGAARVTGFTKNKYDKKKGDPTKALDEFEKYLYNPDYLIIGQNILGFDVYIHNIHRKLCGKSSDYSYINRIVDTNCIARAIKMNINLESDEDFILWQYKLLSHRKKGIKTNLRQLCKDYDIEFKDKSLHDAIYDVKKTHEVLMKMIWDIEI